MLNTPYIRAFQNDISKAIAVLTQQRILPQSASSSQVSQPGMRPDQITGIPKGGEPINVANIVDRLDERIERLSLVREWITSDAEIAHLIDATIGRQVRAAERRQARLSVVLTVVSLVVGWLLSLVGSPATLLRIGH